MHKSVKYTILCSIHQATMNSAQVNEVPSGAIAIARTHFCTAASANTIASANCKSHPLQQATATPIDECHVKPCGPVQPGLQLEENSAVSRNSPTTQLTALDTIPRINASPDRELDQTPTKLTSMGWLRQRFANHAIPGVFPPNPDDPITDAAEIAFANALTIRPDLLHTVATQAKASESNMQLQDPDVTMEPKADAKLDTHPIATDMGEASTSHQINRRRKASAMTTLKHDLPPRKTRRLQSSSEQSELTASSKLLFAPVGAAAAEVGLPKAVVQRWITDEQVACIRPQPNNSHRLVDMKDLRQYLQHKRSRINTVKSQTRVLIYALVEPTLTAAHALNAQPDGNENSDSSSESESDVRLDERIVGQVREIADAFKMEHGKYMYNGDIANASDWSNRPCFDLMVDKILSREIHTIVALSSDHLAQGCAFSLLQRLCQRNGVSIKCVNHGDTGAAAQC